MKCTACRHANPERAKLVADDGRLRAAIFIDPALVEDGRIRRDELFGEADAERAVARFDALCAQVAGGARDPA